MFDRVLNVLLNWLPDVSFLNQYECQRRQVTSTRKNQKESKANFKIVERKCCCTELIHTFSNFTLSSQTLANINIHEIFQT